MIVPFIDKFKIKYLRKKVLKQKMYNEKDFYIIYCSTLLDKYPYMYPNWNRTTTHTKRVIKYKAGDRLDHLRSKRLQNRDDKYEIMRLEKLDRELEEEYMNYQKFAYILHKYHENLFHDIITTGSKFMLPCGCGSLSVGQFKAPTGTKMVNFNETKKRKEELLASGVDEKDLKNVANPKGTIPYVVYFLGKYYFKFIWRKAQKDSTVKFKFKLVKDGYPKRTLINFTKDKNLHGTTLYPTLKR